MKDCVFCKIASGDIPCVKIWEDRKFLAFLDINPISKGMTLVIPKKHRHSNFFKNSSKDISEIMIASKKVSKILENSLSIDRVCVIIEGLEIDHLHIKLIPIRKGENLKTILNSANETPDIKYLRNLALKIISKNQA